MGYEHDLHKALMEAFTLEGLARMLQYQMGLDLETISTASDKEAVVAKLVRTAAAEGWLRGLVAAAFAANPGNEKLGALMRMMQMRSEAPMPTHRPPGDEKGDMDERVTDLEYLMGTRGINGVLRKMEAHDKRFDRIESALSLTATPLSPRAAQVLLLIVFFLTGLASMGSAWSLLVQLWSKLGGA